MAVSGLHLRTSSDETAKGLQIDDIEVAAIVVSSLFRLQVHGNFPESLVVEQIAKRLQPHFAPANMLVTVLAGTQRL